MSLNFKKPPVSHPPSFVAQVLTECHGHTRVAASKLKMDVGTVRAYCRKYPECREAKDLAIGDLVEHAESNLYEYLLDGDRQVTLFVLSTLAKDKYNKVIVPEQKETVPKELNFTCVGEDEKDE